MIGDLSQRRTSVQGAGGVIGEDASAARCRKGVVLQRGVLVAS